MTEPSAENQVKTEVQPSDKELNFRRQEAMFQRQLEQERAERLRIQQELEEERRKKEVEEDDPEPYVDHKKLEKKLNNFGQQQKKQTMAETQQAIQQAIEQERQSAWLDNHEDFNEVMKHAEKFAKKHPKLADSILKMPEGLERQKLVYANIKAMGMDQPEEKKESIQEKIDANRQSPFYQPSGVATVAYSSQSDFSPKGQKESYQKMQELKNRLKI